MLVKINKGSVKIHFIDFQVKIPKEVDVMPWDIKYV